LFNQRAVGGRWKGVFHLLKHESFQLRTHQICSLRIKRCQLHTDCVGRLRWQMLADGLHDVLSVRDDIHFSCEPLRLGIDGNDAGFRLYKT
jgi:hypothetical protein